MGTREESKTQVKLPTVLYVRSLMQDESRHGSDDHEKSQPTIGFAASSTALSTYNHCV